jgi:hypothetical protein
MVYKEIVWKTLMNVWKSNLVQSDRISTKQLMLIYRYASIWKSGKSNFLNQVSNKALEELIN